MELALRLRLAPQAAQGSGSACTARTFGHTAAVSSLCPKHCLHICAALAVNDALSHLVHGLRKKLACAPLMGEQGVGLVPLTT